MISILDFVSERKKENLFNYNDKIESSEYKKIIKSKIHSSNIFKEIGNLIFNLNPISGISFLIYLNLIQSSISGISSYLHNGDKRKDKIGEFLTNFNIKEIIQILKNYSEHFKFEGMSFNGALRRFLSHLELANDPEKIDIVLFTFANKFFKDHSKKNQCTFFSNGFFEEKSTIFIIFYYFLLFFIIFYYFLLFFIIFYYFLLFFIIFYYFLLFFIIFYYFLLFFIIFYYFLLFFIIFYYFLLFFIIFYYFLLFFIIFYYFLLFFIIFYYFLLFFIIFYYFLLFLRTKSKFPKC